MGGMQPSRHVCEQRGPQAGGSSSSPLLSGVGAHSTPRLWDLGCSWLRALPLVMSSTFKLGILKYL